MSIPGKVRVRYLLIYITAGLLLMLGVSGCAIGPNYVKPTIPEPVDWLDNKDFPLKTDKADLTRWWTVFDDPVLDNLINLAYQQNPDLHIVGLRILEARAQLAVLVGNRYPQLQQLQGDITAVHASEHGANTTSAADLRYLEAGIGFDAAWEMDVWGKFNRAVNSGVGTLNASIANYDDTLVSLTAEIARNYVLLRTFEARRAIALQNVSIQSRSLQIASVKFRGGDVTELDVAQARTILANTQASIPRLESQIRQSENTLALLLGIRPSDLQEIIDETGRIPTVSPEVVVGIPAEMLRRRPDIRQAEFQMMAQNELIGVAKADLYPHFSLIGSIGLRSSDSSLTAAGFPGGSSLNDLIDTDSIEYFFGPRFSWDFLNYGRIKNRVRIEDSRLQQLISNYRSTILRAIKETENGIVAYLQSQKEHKFLADSSRAASRSVDLSMLQYKEGLADYQRVLDTQRALVEQQDLLTANQGAIAINLISLYKALGGGWESQVSKPFVPKSLQQKMQERTDWGELLEQNSRTTSPTEKERLLKVSFK